MAIVVRLGPLPLGRRRASRVAELERILATAVEVIEVIDVTRLASAIAVRKVAAVALDAPGTCSPERSMRWRSHTRHRRTTLFT